MKATESAIITVGEVGDVSVIAIEGYLKLTPKEDGRLRGADELWKVINDLIEDGCCRIVVDLTNVPHMDSSGMGRITDGYRVASQHRGALKVVLKPGSRCESLFAMTRVNEIIKTYSDEAAAIASFTE